MMTSARLPSATSSAASSDPKNRAQRGNAARVRGRGLVGRGVDAEHRHAELGEVPQQVAVVARDLHDEARRTEPALGDEPQRRSRGCGAAARRRTTRSRGSCRRTASRPAPPPGSGRASSSRRTRRRAGTAPPCFGSAPGRTSASASGVLPSERNAFRSGGAARAALGDVGHGATRSPPTRSPDASSTKRSSGLSRPEARSARTCAIRMMRRAVQDRPRRGRCARTRRRAAATPAGTVHLLSYSGNASTSRSQSRGSCACRGRRRRRTSRHSRERSTPTISATSRTR